VRNVVARLSPRGNSKLRMTLPKQLRTVTNREIGGVASVTRIAAAPSMMTDHSQSLGMRPLENTCWEQAYEDVHDVTRAQAAVAYGRAGSGVGSPLARGQGGRPWLRVRRALFAATSRTLRRGAVSPTAHQPRAVSDSDLRTSYVAAWLSANVGLHNTLSKGAVRRMDTPTPLTALVLVFSCGLL
jgi:hypothetical protein